jgi:hypothetical protein
LKERGKRKRGGGMGRAGRPNNGQTWWRPGPRASAALSCRGPWPRRGHNPCPTCRPIESPCLSRPICTIHGTHLRPAGPPARDAAAARDGRERARGAEANLRAFFSAVQTVADQRPSWPSAASVPSKVRRHVWFWSRRARRRQKRGRARNTARAWSRLVRCPIAFRRYRAC